MPVAIPPSRPRTGVTCLTGGRLIQGLGIVEEDLWISSVTGKILHSQKVFYEHHIVPDEVIDLQGKILCPGFIDVQFNGGFGYDFSTIPKDEHGRNDMDAFVKGLQSLNRKLVRTGVTSYLPTLPSNHPELYHATLPYLGPSGAARNAAEGSESLGAHCEGPFISPTKNGIHSREVLREAEQGMADLELCYGAENLHPPAPPPPPPPTDTTGTKGRNPTIRMITAAPEVPGIAALIPELTHARGIIFSVGHTEATYEQVRGAMQQGATMITHLFNAMPSLHHRNPGPFGVLGHAEGTPRPFFGIISDGIHLHPTTVKIAWNAHPAGFILVTDAMKTMGLPDGIYEWTNGDRFVKKGPVLTLAGTDRLAGSSASLVECLSHFWTWTRASIPEAIAAVTATPAKMLGLEKVKGTLAPDADADLLLLRAVEGDEEGGMGRFEVEKVWKFGVLVHDQCEEISHLPL